MLEKMSFCGGNSTKATSGINGTITREMRGSNGFGYDPVFMPDGFSKTFAEMSAEEKNSISHRKIALKKLLDFLETVK